MNARIRALAICGATMAFSDTWPAAAELRCIDQPYRGFDTRLEVDIVGKVPIADQPVGFEMVQGRPVVAFPHRLIAADGQRLIVQPSLDTIQALTVDAAGRVRIQANHRVKRFAAESLVDEGPVAARGLIHNSGAPAFLITNSTHERTRLMVAGQEKATSALDADAPLRRASLNAIGLAAVIGDSLVTWTPGSRTLKTLAVDVGLRQVIDVVLIGPNRAVVALPNVLILITDRTRVVLGALDARVRWEKGTLHAMDQRSGIIWALTGLEGIGLPENDRAHARRLAAGARSASAPEFLEAVRLAGCQASKEAAAFKTEK